MIRLRHGHLDLALHELRDGVGLPLLLLHELGARSDAWRVAEVCWSGPVLGLDFSGHGQSDWPRGGCYQPEYWAGDADAVLAHVGPAALLGAGVGAYVGLLLAGARPQHIAVVGMLPGAGLHGGGPVPQFGRSAYATFVAPVLPRWTSGADPQVAMTEAMIRPPDYVGTFARKAPAIVLVEEASSCPPWWEDVAGGANVIKVGGGIGVVSAAMARIARV